MYRPIIVVDDNADDVDLMFLAFKRERIRQPVIWLSSGEELVDWLWCAKKYRERDLTILPLVVVLDLKMFDVDGLTSMRFIREGRHIAKVPIIIHSDSKDPDDIALAYEQGADKYIVKDAAHKELCREIRRLSASTEEYREPAD